MMTIHVSCRIGLVLALTCLITLTAEAQRQMETLGRGVVAVRTSSTNVLVGWRLLGADPDDVGFNVYRSTDGDSPVKLNDAPVTNVTEYADPVADLTRTNAWFVCPVTNGVEWAASAAFTLPAGSPVR